MKQFKMRRYYTSPSVKVYKTMAHLHLENATSQKEEDWYTIQIAVMVWMLNISASNMVSLSFINYNDGRISQHLEGNLKNFVTSCFKGKRECTFASLFNWVLQSRRSCKDLDWKRTNPNKLTRELWNTLPKALKKGAKESMGSIIYSTK